MSEENRIESIVSQMRAQIKSGEFKEGRLPKISELVSTHGVTRTTIYTILDVLRAEGLITARGGYYEVNYPPIRIVGAPLFDKLMESLGQKSATENIIEPEIATIPNDIADSFEIPKGTQFIHRMRRHGTEDTPYRLAENWYPIGLALPFLEAMKQNPDLNVLGEIRKTQGIAIAKRVDDVSARLPTLEERTLLNIFQFAPVLDVVRRFLSADNRLLLLSKQSLVGSIFQLTYDVPRDKKETSSSS